MRCIDEYFLHHVTQRISQRFAKSANFLYPDSSNARLERAIRSAVTTVKSRSLPLGVGVSQDRSVQQTQQDMDTAVCWVQSFIVIFVK